MEGGSSSSSAAAEATSYSFRSNRRKSWNLGSFHRSTETYDLIAEYFNAVMKRIVSDFVRKLGEKVFQSKEKFASQFEASLMKIRGRLNINPNYTTVEVVLKNFLEDISLLKGYAPQYLEISEDEKAVIAEKAAGVKALVPAVLYFYVKMFEQSAINKDGTKFQSALEQIYAEVSSLVPSFTSEMKSFCQKEAIDMEALLMNAKDNPLLKLDMNLKSEDTIQFVRNFFAEDGLSSLSALSAPTSNASENDTSEEVVANNVAVEEQDTHPIEDTNSVNQTNVITPAKGNQSAKKKTPKSSRKRKVQEMEEVAIQPSAEEEATEVPVDEVNKLPAEDIATLAAVIPETREVQTPTAETMIKPTSPAVSAPINKRSRRGKKSHEPVIEDPAVPIEMESEEQLVLEHHTLELQQPEMEMKTSEQSSEHVSQAAEEERHDVAPISKITKRGKSKRRSKGVVSDLPDEPQEGIQSPGVSALPEEESKETQEAVIEPEFIAEEVVGKASAKSKKKGGKKGNIKPEVSVVDIAMHESVEPDATTPSETEAQSNQEHLTVERTEEETNMDKFGEEVHKNESDKLHENSAAISATEVLAEDCVTSLSVDTVQPTSEAHKILPNEAITEAMATPVLTRRGSKRRKSEPAVEYTEDMGQQAVGQDEVSGQWVESTPRPSRRRAKKTDNDTTITPSEVEAEEAVPISEEQVANVVDISQSVLSPVVPSFRELISTSTIQLAVETPQQITNKMRLSFRRFVAPIEENLTTEDSVASRKRKSDEISATGTEEEEFNAAADYSMEVDMDAPLLETVCEDVSKPVNGKKSKKSKSVIASSSSSSGEARIAIDGVEEAEHIAEEESTRNVIVEEQTKKKLGRPKKVMDASVSIATAAVAVPRTAELIKEFFPAKKRQRRHRMIFEDEEESEDSDSEEEESKGEKEDMVLFSKDEVEKLIKGIVAIQQGCALMDTWLQLQS